MPLLFCGSLSGLSRAWYHGSLGRLWEDGRANKIAKREPPTPQKRLLALGDSDTIGESVAESERWPVQLAKLLVDETIELKPPKIIAQTGWTTSELLAGIDATRPTGVFELVSPQIGVNNQFRGLDERQYVRELESLFD